MPSVNDIIIKPLTGVFNSGKWAPINDYSIIKNGVDFIKLRNWQKEILKLRQESDLPHIFLNCPTGAGKSKAGLALISESEQFTRNLVIISAPQKEIGKGFLKSTGTPQNILEHTWMINPMNQLCEGLYKTEEGNVGRLLEFIKNPRLKDLNDRILICCHATLSLLFDRMSSNDKSKYLRNIKLCIDESHHSLSQEESGNGLGKVVNYFLKHTSKDLNLMMMTATPFRGDKGSLIPEKYSNSFCRYDLDYGRHFEENCDGLEFTYNAVLHQYGDSYGKVIKSLMDRHLDSNDKVLVQIPSSNRKISNGKFEDLQMIYDSIGRTQKVDSHGVVHIKHKKKWIKVLDLITEKNRSQRLDYLRANPVVIDVVIGIAIIKEGFDWPCANAGILIGSQGSLNAQIQIMGRMFRAFTNKGKNKGKPPVVISQIFPFIDHEKLEEDEVREQINTFMKVVYAALAMELVINPIHIDLPIKTDKKGKELPRQSVKTYLLEHLTDVQYTGLMASVMDDYRDWKANAEDGVDVTGKLSEIVGNRLTELGIEENHKEIGQFFERTLQKSAKFQIMAMDGIDVSHIDIELMEDITDPIDNILMGMTNGLCGAANLREFQELMKPVDSTRRCYDMVEFVKKNGEFPNVNSDDPIERSLGNFMSQCKYVYRNGKSSKSVNLSQQHVDILESIKNWNWAYLDKLRDRILELKKFLKANKKYPSVMSLDMSEKSLAIFISNIKKCYRGKSESYSLTGEHIKCLEQIEDWTWVTVDEKTIKQAMEVYNHHSNTGNMPLAHTKLNIILNRFRKNYKTGNIPNECVDILNKIPNFKWAREVDLYVRYAQELIEWINENGKNPSSRAIDSIEKLHGRRAALFRQAYKNQGKLKINKIQMGILNSCELWVWDASSDFTHRLTSLKTWIDIETRLPRHSGCVLEKHHWRTYRSYLKRGMGGCSDEELGIIENISVWSWENIDRITPKIYDVIEWSINNSKIPNHGSSDLVERSLGYFRREVKNKKREGKLSENQINLLESIPDWRW